MSPSPGDAWKRSYSESWQGLETEKGEARGSPGWGQDLVQANSPWPRGWAGGTGLTVGCKLKAGSLDCVPTEGC